MKDYVFAVKLVPKILHWLMITKVTMYQFGMIARPTFSIGFLKALVDEGPIRKENCKRDLLVIGI